MFDIHCVKITMTATETYDLLTADLDKTLKALLNVRTIDEIKFERRSPGFVYDQDRSLHEYWIALSQFTVSANLSYLRFVFNTIDEIPKSLDSRQTIADFCTAFKNYREKIIQAFDSIIDKPNMVFFGYPQPITMEVYLQKVVENIHDEAVNLEYNYNKLQA